MKLQHLRARLKRLEELSTGLVREDLWWRKVEQKRSGSARVMLFCRSTADRWHPLLTSATCLERPRCPYLCSAVPGILKEGLVGKPPHTHQTRPPNTRCGYTARKKYPIRMTKEETQ
jgi:hypothetical protein